MWLRLSPLPSLVSHLASSGLSASSCLLCWVGLTLADPAWSSAPATCSADFWSWVCFEGMSVFVFPALFAKFSRARRATLAPTPQDSVLLRTGISGPVQENLATKGTTAPSFHPSPGCGPIRVPGCLKRRFPVLLALFSQTPLLVCLVAQLGESWDGAVGDGGVTSLPPPSCKEQPH